MDTASILSLLKMQLGISTTVKDTLLTSKVNSAIAEIEDALGVMLSETDPRHIDLAVDFAAWKYENPDAQLGIPRFIEFRIHNLQIKKAATEG